MNVHSHGYGRSLANFPCSFSLILTKYKSASTCVCTRSTGWVGDAKSTFMNFIKFLFNSANWNAVFDRRHTIVTPLVAHRVGTITSNFAHCLQHTHTMGNNTLLLIALRLDDAVVGKPSRRVGRRGDDANRLCKRRGLAGKCNSEKKKH